MKKYLKYLAVLAAAALLGFLVMQNRQNAAKDDERIAVGELTFETAGGETVYTYRDDGDGYVTFETEMRRKNGDVFPKTYSGRELSSILNEAGISFNEGTGITLICADQYEIGLTGAEVLQEGNVYIVNRESGELLDEESGPFMLVINGDEFATRWGKTIVRIRISE